MNAKQAAAFRAVGYVKDGMIIGLGTGTTAYWAIQYLGERIKQGLTVTTVATSEETARIARECGINVVALDSVEHIDIDIDGADEIDGAMNLIKGGGGALLREKIVAACSDEFIVIADNSKKVETLGNFPLPVEILPFGWRHTAAKLKALGCSASLREKDEKTFITDNGNYILDCRFGAIGNAADLESEINTIPGVVECGLFVKMAGRVILGYADGTVKELGGQG